jgi:hypothetical protein
MNFGVVALIVLCSWSLISVVTSLVVGGMSRGRDDTSIVDLRVTDVAEHADTEYRADARRRDLAS